MEPVRHVNYKFDNYLSISPFQYTGVPLHGIARSQINLVMRNMKGFNEKIRRFSDISIPLVWIEYVSNASVAKPTSNFFQHSLNYQIELSPLNKNTLSFLYFTTCSFTYYGKVFIITSYLIYRGYKQFLHFVSTRWKALLLLYFNSKILEGVPSQSSGRSTLMVALG